MEISFIKLATPLALMCIISFVSGFALGVWAADKEKEIDENERF